MSTLLASSRISSSLSGAGSSDRRLEHDGFFTHHGVWAPGVRLFRQLGFTAKALIILGAMAVPAAILAMFLLGSLFETAQTARQTAVRQHVEVAHGVLVWAHAQETSGVLTREQAQQAALKLVAGLRYDKQEYFWVSDRQARIVMHPIRPELNGQDGTTIADPNGVAIFRQFAEVARGGAGFVRYQWARPNSTTPVDKVSYVMGFEPWGWVIGTGVYVDDIMAMVRRQMLVTVVAALAILLVVSYLALSFYKVMVGGLKETRRHLRAMSDGDLTTAPVPWGQDEAAQLMLDLASTQDAMRRMVARVRHAGEDIVCASSEIAAGMKDLATRSEQSASSLEQSAAAMEQIAVTVRNTSANTAEVAQMAHETAEAAAEGGRVMNHVVATMEGIHASSSRIDEITATIDGIALQTNILAVNAAVEAARAGEQGRGFAIVAGEVRTLAQRSAQASQEIRRIVSGSVEQIAAGATVVRDAGQAIGRIVEASRRVNELLEDISTGAREQTVGVEQIGEAVHDLDRTTQQNAALVSQTASASNAMKLQAQQLAGEVARFRLPEGYGQEVGATAESGVDELFDVDAAIEAHRQWKVRLRRAFSGQESVNPDTLCRDDVCTLGKWLHGPGGSRWGTRPLFSELLARHAEFHRVAGGVARQIRPGRSIDPEPLIGAGSDFAQVSLDVTTLLTRVRREF